MTNPSPREPMGPAPAAGLPDDMTIYVEDFGLSSLTVDVTTPSLTHRGKSRSERGIGRQPMAEPILARRADVGHNTAVPIRESR
jgi:hypothetical protein